MTQGETDDFAAFLSQNTDPVERLLLTGAAATVSEAEEIVLNTSLDAVTDLLRGPLGR